MKPLPMTPDEAIQLWNESMGPEGELTALGKQVLGRAAIEIPTDPAEVSEQHAAFKFQIQSVEGFLTSWARDIKGAL